MQSCSCLLQAKLAAADAAAAQGAASADGLATLQQRIAKLEAQKAGLNEALQAGQAEIAALQVGGGSAVLQPLGTDGPSAVRLPLTRLLATQQPDQPSYMCAWQASNLQASTLPAPIENQCTGSVQLFPS